MSYTSVFVVYTLICELAPKSHTERKYNETSVAETDDEQENGDK